MNTVKIIEKQQEVWNYYRDEPSNPLFSNSESFKYKTNIAGKTPEDNDSLTDIKLVILKYLSNFWKSLNIPIINCDLELILTWSKKLCFSWYDSRCSCWSSYWAPSDAKFKITYKIICSCCYFIKKKNDIKLLEKLKSGFKKTIKWNKYRSQMTIQPQNNNLNYLIDPTFTNVNRLFVLPFARNNFGDNRDSFQIIMY